MEELLELMGKHISLEKELVEELYQFSEVMSFPKQAEIRSNGYIWKELYFISKGLVRHYHIKLDGEERSCDFSVEQQFFTDFQSLNENVPSRNNYKAMEPTTLVRIPYERLMEAYNTYPQLEHFGRIMTEETTSRIAQMTHGLLMLSSEERYENLLQSRPELFQRVPQKYLASYLGLKAESLSRVKRSLLRNREKR